MTSSKTSGFWTPSLHLSVPNSRNLPSFCQNLADPLPPPQCRRHLYIAPKFLRTFEISVYRSRICVLNLDRTNLVDSST